MSLNLITFTGVDDATDLTHLAAIARSYTTIRPEFGVLIGSSTFNPAYDEYRGIFPSVQRATDLRDLGRILGFDTALHICGDPVRNLLTEGEAQNGQMSNQVYGLSYGFTRVQLNLHGDEWNEQRIEATAQRLRTILPYLGGQHVILQHRAEWEAVPDLPARVEFLFDRSEGRGILDLLGWPRPPAPEFLPRVGYAGGLDNTNIAWAVRFARSAPGAVWLDMESRIRTNGKFDLDKVERVYRAAIKEMVSGTGPQPS